MTGPDGVRILRRFVKDYRPPTPEFFEGFRRILYLEPNPEPEYSDERIDEIFELLEECPLLIEERNPIPRQHIPPPLPDQDGWTTMPNKQ